jgi:hypothetical protein
MYVSPLALALQSWSASPNSVTSNMIGEEHSVSSFHTGNDSLLRVQVESSLLKTTFYVPVSLMLQREVEMKDAAKKTNIREDRWSASRLYSLWKSTSRRGEEETTLRLSPETSMKDYSELKWKPWLTTCIRAYYNTGTIQIPEDCLGSDILLALEYFGILTTSPDTFVFDSYPAYLRIKRWSAYFTHRNTIAGWVLHDYNRVRGGKDSRIWVASQDSRDMIQSETLLQVNGETAAVLAGGLDVHTRQTSCKAVYDLFAENESEHTLTKEMPSRMRQDFCEHLLRSLSSKTDVWFQIEQVKIAMASGRVATELRAVLRVRTGVQSKQMEATQRVVLKDSSGMGFQLGLDSVELSAPSSSRELRFSGEASNVSETFGRAAPAHDNSRFSSYSPYGAEANLDGLLPTTQQLSSSSGSGSTVSNSIEQRHPQRSTPPPDSRRLSPEDLYKQTISNPSRTTNRQTISDREFLKQIENAAPVGFVNTNFGDLRSVTSGLSGTYMDGEGSSIAEFTNNPVVASAIRQVLAKNKEESKPKEPEKIEVRPERPAQRATNATSFEVAEIEEREQDPTTKPSNNFDNAPQSCGFYWGGFLATICEAVVPGPPQNNRSTSPVRTVTIPTVPVASVEEAKGTHRGAHRGTRRIPTTNSPDPTAEAEFDLFAKAEEVYKTASMEQTADWLRSECSTLNGKMANDNEGDESYIPKTPSKDSAVLNAAKNVGKSMSMDNISNQIDQFFTNLALDETETSKSREKRENKRKIPKKKPMPTRISSTKNEDAPFRRTSSTKSREEITKTEVAPFRQSSTTKSREEIIKKEVAPLRRARSSKSSEKCRSAKESDLISKQNRHKIEVNPSRPSASSQAKSRPLGWSTRAAEVQLPPRQPRRARAHEKFCIARKKQSAETMPPSHPSNSTIPKELPQNSSKTLSTAKIAKNTMLAGLSQGPSTSAESAGNKSGGREGKSCFRLKK